MNMNLVLLNLTRRIYPIAERNTNWITIEKNRSTYGIIFKELIEQDLQ